MKKSLITFSVFLTITFSEVTAQNIFRTASGTISFPGDLVYSGNEYDMNSGNIWVQGYSAIEGDSVYYTKLLHIDDKSISYYCIQYAACLKDVFMFGESVETLDDPTLSGHVHMFMLMGKAENNKRMKSVYRREYSKDDLRVVKRYEEYSMLFPYSDKKEAVRFYKQLLALVGTTEQKE